MSGADGTYIHGTEPDEQGRLARLNRLINSQSLSRMNPQPGQRVLDVGCGFGLFAHEIAARVGSEGRVVGIERAAAQVEQGQRLAAELAFSERAEIRIGDAYAFPLRDDEWGTFDIAHARFLLEHLERPADVVAAMVRAVKPGGRVILEDDDHEALILFPALPEFEAVWRAYARAYDVGDRDPRIGRKLVALLAAAGAQPTRCDWPFFGSCAGAETFDAIITNCRAILTGARESIVRDGAISGGDLDAGLRAYDTWRTRPDASYWYCTFWAEGRRATARQ
ncbi:MAG TPA: methyltransferase domain-containing protein [Candidatus Krumholzibacteria bacterium]|nr:methyltransferase domain-containing protein [Candidatus Krumholzibacteria bacterium]